MWRENYALFSAGLFYFTYQTFIKKKKSFIYLYCIPTSTATKLKWTCKPTGNHTKMIGYLFIKITNNKNSSFFFTIPSLWSIYCICYNKNTSKSDQMIMMRGRERKIVRTNSTFISLLCCLSFRFFFCFFSPF